MNTMQSIAFSVADRTECSEFACNVSPSWGKHREKSGEFRLDPACLWKVCDVLTSKAEGVNKLVNLIVFYVKAVPREVDELWNRLRARLQ
jgi:hypothetical protein